MLDRVFTGSGAARRWVYSATALTAAVALAFSLTSHDSATAQGAPQRTLGNGAAITAAAPISRSLPDFADLVERVGPSVVNIRVSTKARAASANGAVDEEMQEFFRRFFGIPVPRGNGSPRRSQPTPEDDSESRPSGVGSGFIVSADGYVMTNAHVVDGADEVVVRLTDKREFKAKVVGADKRTDVALLKISASGLPVVRFGDTSRVRVGEWVIAIGSPFDLDNTVTAGIVSAKARDTGDLVPFIQTDVAINPGNSGGPLINLNGEVVGVNSQIYSRSGGYMGISFAIPIDEASRVAEQLRTNGKVVRGRIGVQIAEVSKDVADSLGLPKASGAMVRGVEAGGPAEKAGLEAGDIVTRFNGQAVDKWSDLPRLVGATKPGTKATLQVFRRGSTKDLSITIAELEPDTAAAKASGKDEGQASPSSALTSLGVAVADLSDAQRRQLKIKSGVQVTQADGPAARAGIQEGDLILSVANQEVTSAKQFEQFTAKLDRNKAVNLLVRRGEWAQYVLVKPASGR